MTSACARFTSGQHTGCQCTPTPAEASKLRTTPLLWGRKRRRTKSFVSGPALTPLQPPIPRIVERTQISLTNPCPRMTKSPPTCTETEQEGRGKARVKKESAKARAKAKAVKEALKAMAKDKKAAGLALKKVHGSKHKSIFTHQRKWIATYPKLRRYYYHHHHHNIKRSIFPCPTGGGSSGRSEVGARQREPAAGEGRASGARERAPLCAPEAPQEAGEDRGHGALDCEAITRAKDYPYTAVTEAKKKLAKHLRQLS